MICIRYLTYKSELAKTNHGLNQMKIILCFDFTNNITKDTDRDKCKCAINMLNILALQFTTSNMYGHNIYCDL